MNGRKARALREQARRAATPGLQPVNELHRKGDLEVLTRTGVPLKLAVQATHLQWPARSYRRHVQDLKRQLAYALRWCGPGAAPTGLRHVTYGAKDENT